eukprot:CAMPEP_0171434930 /NCGR_PEP_ID=MMETSP0881-20121228/10985_1 /TAXON_ID=67004 /ORGANISM="Thalassiosira weissflogii, Strain CCMP1336" /LENGTH=57 /DNA_ID=CAMNT_0011955845 /DNA_START=19 /DNA_END=189 /DNA_ORIENTATION=-
MMEEQEEAEEHEERWLGKEGGGKDGCGRKAPDAVIMVVSANDAAISARADLLLPLLG